MPFRKLPRCALLATVALTIFVLEARIPLPLPIPGLKLGLSNIVILYALFALGWREAAAILTVRLLLGNLITGQIMAMLYALGGGILSFSVMALLRPHLKDCRIWVAGVLGSLAHNLGQMAVAVVVTQSPPLLLYLPVLLLCALFTGAFTGLCAQFLLHRIPKK